MIGWLKDLFMNKETRQSPLERDKEVINRLTRAQKEIERSKRLLRASGYYNDRLEGIQNGDGRST